MATTTIRITHERAGDFTVASNARLPQVVSRLQNFLNGGVAGNYAIDTIELSQDQATGTVTLSGVDGVAASGTVTLGGGAGDVEVIVDGTSAGEIPFNTDDDTTAADFVTEWNSNPTAFAKATASAVGPVITMTWNVKGTVGNSKTLSATRTAGTATASGATLSGGAQNTVTVTVGGEAVATDTTTLSNDAAATAVAAAINANATAADYVTASASSNVVTLTALAAGEEGNGISLVAATTNGTATASAGNLTGGTSTTHTR